MCEVMLEGERTPAEGASLTAGECKKFHIHARDAAGALKSIGGDIFVLTAKVREQALHGSIAMFSAEASRVAIL